MGRLDLPRHLVSQPESVVSTVATLMRGIPLASRDAASCAESFVHVLTLTVPGGGVGAGGVGGAGGGGGTGAGEGPVCGRRHASSV